MIKRSRYETILDEQLALGQLLDGSEREYSFDDVRNWRFDRAWPCKRIAVEIDGGNHMAVISKRTGRPIAVGRHTQSEDYRKLNRATALGWKVFRFTPEMIKSGEAFATVQDAINELPFTV